MNHDTENEAVENLNAGKPVPPVDPAYLKNAWEALSRLPAELRGTVSLDVRVISGDAAPDLMNRDPGQYLAFGMRLATLQALIERGALNDYMQDNAQRARVFRAAATMPCNKYDFAEAMSQQMLRDSPPDVAAKTREGMLAGDLDPDHPKVIAKFIAWMEQQA
jgi:hypothetical protein